MDEEDIPHTHHEDGSVTYDEAQSASATKRSESTGQEIEDRLMNMLAETMMPIAEMENPAQQKLLEEHDHDHGEPAMVAEEQDENSLAAIHASVPTALILVAGQLFL